MFFGALLQWLGSILGWVSGLFTVPPPPAFLGSGAEQLSQIINQAAWLCRFVDFSMWPDAIITIASIWVLGLTIRIVRIVFGFFIG